MITSLEGDLIYGRAYLRETLLKGGLSSGTPRLHVNLIKRDLD